MGTLSLFCVRRACERAAPAEGLALRRGLVFLRAIAETAGHCGGLLSVRCIAGSFKGLATEASDNTWAVVLVGELANALVPLAAGMALGPLAVGMYAFLEHRVQTMELEMHLAML